MLSQRLAADDSLRIVMLTDHLHECRTIFALVADQSLVAAPAHLY